MKLVNLTPHTIGVLDRDGNITSIKPSGTVARVNVDYSSIAVLDNFTIYESAYGEVAGLPASQDGTGYIVSTLVAEVVQGREDLFSPGKLIRDLNGNPVACNGLVNNGAAKNYR
jgi:hypothetical protein